MKSIIKTLIILGIFSLILGFIGCKVIKTRPQNIMYPQAKKSIYDFTVKSIDGEEISLSDFKGKKMLIVNVASECGYTPQYKGLQKLYEIYGDKLVVLGFPANNFGEQEPGTNAEIIEFCTKNYNVTFPMCEKTSVKGSDMHPVYKWLSTPADNGWNDKAPNWNFCKYLIDEKGELQKYYSFAVEPLDDAIINEIK